MAWQYLFRPQEPLQEQKTESPATPQENPQGQPSMEAANIPPSPQPPAPPAPTAAQTPQTAAPPEGPPPAQGGGETAPSQPAPAQTGGEALPPLPPQPKEAEDVTIETQYLRAVFTSKGGALKSLEILPFDGKQYGIELIDFNGEAHQHLSLLVNTAENGNPTGAENIYSIARQTGTLVEFTTEWDEGENRKSLVKTFDFTRKDGDSPYAFHVTLQFKSTKPDDKIKFTLTGSAAITKADPFIPNDNGHIITRDKHDSYTVPGVFESEKSLSGAKISLVAVTGKYFATALIPITLAERDGDATLAPSLTAKEGGTKDERENSIVESLAYEVPLVPFETTGAAGYRSDSGACEFIFYTGPRQEEKLAALVKQCPRITELKASMGWWLIGDIGKAILFIMNGIQKVVGNYGLAIIVLTIAVRLAMFPLSKKQQLSMQKMQKLQPRMKAIKDKYKGNRQKQNEETIKLYKQYGVNPASGCLPLLIQLPVFFGLFGALRYAIELRKASFLGYINDLSLPDGHGHPALQMDFTVPLINFHIAYLNILPLVMIVVWVLQQALAPRAVDPQQRQQQKMMMVMPVVFGFLLYNYAAGLSIYMICNMFLGLVEQTIVKRIVRKHLSEELPQVQECSSMPRLR
jgi:YidC/Oxa1 family membrane protein insertase